MIFKKSKESEATVQPQASATPQITVIADSGLHSSADFATALGAVAPGYKLSFAAPGELSPQHFSASTIYLSVFQEPAVLDKILEAVLQQRNARKDGYPLFIIAAKISALTPFGQWLHTAASQDRLQGLRLVGAEDPMEIPEQLRDKLEPVLEPNVIRMPVSPEVDCKDFKYFFTITPELRALVRTMRELAQNGVTRVYLLGGPGTGKTSVAYYYYLCRNKGNFVTINLTAESTGDKESMKSLLCGHVTGAIAGGGSREGALSHAGEGVAFLDESHGVTGVVMQVLMEVLDSGQFLPFGATKKRSLDCAVIFASNRSWEALRNLMNLDEHARLGATIVRITDLAHRREDLLAVLSTTLAKFARQCQTWKAPQGLSREAWEAFKRCKWHGNTRTLIRVTEAGCIAHSLAQNPSSVISGNEVLQAIDLWEPEEHESLKVYTSFESAEG